MTQREALNYLKEHYLDDILSDNFFQALCIAIDALTAAVKAENKPTDERKSTAWVTIPEASDSPAEDDFRAEIGDIKDAIVDLQIKVGILERKIE